MFISSLNKCPNNLRLLVNRFFAHQLFWESQMSRKSLQKL